MIERLPTIVIAALAVACAACRERPAQCAADALGGLDDILAERSDALAPRSLEAAKVELERVMAHVRGQEQRWRPLQRWDAELCKKGAAALAQARADLATARAARDQALAIEKSAADTLASARAQLAALAAFLDGGVVGPDVGERIARARGLVDGAQARLALSLGELRGAGFLGSTEPVRKVAAEIDAAARELSALGTDAAVQAVARCRPRLGSAVPAFTGAPRVLNDWLMWRGSVDDREALMVFRLDRERRSCRQIAARADDAERALHLDGDVRVWRAGGRVPAQILAGFSERGAWFVPQGGGMFAFAHDRAARFVSGCIGKVTCDKPEVSLTTMEAMCSCAFGDLDIAIADRSRRVRYLWDGRAIRAEQ